VADLLAARLAPRSEWVVDCGGDIRVGGVREVDIAHPLRTGAATRAVVRDGAVATSSVVARAWTTADGRTAHHLLDPSTGQPAWTGLLTATAFAPTTLAAETLAKVALLRGPAHGRTVLSRHGGVLVHADGDVETIA
jgi:FAD:protein FMN transferase